VSRSNCVSRSSSLAGEAHSLRRARCVGQVGEVLVERTVAEVVPAVRGNKELLDQARRALP